MLLSQVSFEHASYIEYSCIMGVLRQYLLMADPSVGEQPNIELGEQTLHNPRYATESFLYQEFVVKASQLRVLIYSNKNIITNTKW